MSGDTDYIYIILAIAYVIYSIIQAGKKVSKNRPTVTKKSEPTTVHQPKPQPPKEEDTFKKIFEELFGEIPKVEVPEEQATPSKHQPVEEKPAPAKIMQKQHINQKLGSKEKKEPFIKEKPQEEFTHRPELIQMAFANTHQEETIETDFDIRQAVIHSEILKRPNW